MRKIISVLLLIASMLSFYIIYGAERNEYIKNISEIEMSLTNSSRLMLPVSIDNKDKKKNYDNIVKVLDKYDGSIYYDRVSKDESTKIKYIYDKYNMYIANVEIIDSKELAFDLMEPNKYLSTAKSADELQIGTIAKFGKEENREIKTLKSMLNDGLNFSGPCYVAFKNNINVEGFINELENALDTKGITIIEETPINLSQDDNYKFIVLIIYLIVMLLILYDLLNYYKKIGVKKLLGYSAKDIYIESILNLIKINLGIGTIVTIIMSLIFFNQLNVYVYSFILKFIMYMFIGTAILIVICSMAYMYIFFIKISSMLKNKKPLTGIIALNYIAKILCLIAMMFFVVQVINNAESVKGIFNENYSNWEKLDDFAVISEIKIPVEVFNDSNYPKIQQKIYKELNKKGGVLANFNEFSPAIRGIRLAETNHYYESDNVYVNPNYLNKYKIYDSEDNEVVVSDNDKNQIILVPEKYKYDEKNILNQAESFKEQEFYSTGKNQKTKIIWTKSNQKVFTASIDINPNEGNEIVDPIIYVITENNASTSDYNYVMGIMGNPFKIKVDEDSTAEITIREVLSKYGMEEYIGPSTPVNEQVATSIKNIKESIKNSAIYMCLLILVVIVIIIQNAINYFDKYNQKLAIEKLMGYKIIDKYKNYIIGVIICWGIVFSMSILIYKSSIFVIGIISIIGIVIEVIFSLIVLNKIEKKKVINILKGE